MKVKDLVQQLLQHNMHDDVFARVGTRRVEIVQIVRLNDANHPHTALIVESTGDQESDLVLAIEQLIKAWRNEE